MNDKGYYLYAVLRAVNSLVPCFFVPLNPQWLSITLGVIATAVPTLGWLVSLGMWIWAFVIAPDRSVLFIVLFVLECIYFVYRLVLDRIFAHVRK